MNMDPGLPKMPPLTDTAFWDKQDAMVAAIRAKEREDREARRVQREKERWEAIPALYREAFDPKRSRLSREAIAFCKQWTPESGKGVGLVGTTGLGKTRLMCAVIRRFRETHSWMYMPAFEMSNHVANRWSDDDWTAMEATRQLNRVKRTEILVIDDLGDERGTDASTSFLKELSEHRMSRGLPILWTSNLTTKALESKHGVQGAAVVRRLMESCTIF